MPGPSDYERQSNREEASYRMEATLLGSPHQQRRHLKTVRVRAIDCISHTYIAAKPLLSCKSQTGIFDKQVLQIFP